MERAGSACYTCSVSSIETATTQVVLGTCRAWSGRAVAAIPAAYPDGASDYTSIIENVSSRERAGSGCYTCSVSSIEQATIPAELGMCPA